METKIEIAGPEEIPSIKFMYKDEIIVEFSEGTFKYKGTEMKDIDDVYGSFKAFFAQLKAD